jgi:hypothetical protein
MLVDYVMIWTQRLGGFKRQFEGLKRLHGMAAVSRNAKRSVYVMTLSGFSDLASSFPHRPSVYNYAESVFASCAELVTLALSSAYPQSPFGARGLGSAHVEHF